MRINPAAVLIFTLGEFGLRPLAMIVTVGINDAGRVSAVGGWSAENDGAWGEARPESSLFKVTTGLLLSGGINCGLKT